MPTFEYSRWDGSQACQFLSAEAAFERVADALLEYGEYILRQLEHFDPNHADALRLLLDERYLEKDSAGRYALAPRGIRRIEEMALRELFTTANRDTLGKHDTRLHGTGQVLQEESKPYAYGDPVAHLNLHETLRNALSRRRPAAASSSRSRIEVHEDDLVVHETEYQASCATVLLLDQSGSMSRYGKFFQAKRVALALQALVRSRYPEDSFQTIGFYTYAAPLSERQLLFAAPKPVSLFDSRVFRRIPLDPPPRSMPEQFTNLHAGLRFARQALRRQPARNKQIICLTDGEPTGHLEGQEIVLIYPPSERTSHATLEEVQRCAGEGIRLSTFALVEDSYYLTLKNFVDEMARLSRGVAVYCNAGQLGSYVLDSFVSGRRARRHVKW